MEASMADDAHAPLDETGTLSSNGRFFDMSRDRSTMEEVGSEALPSKDELRDDAADRVWPAVVGSQVAISCFHRLTSASNDRRESFLYLSGVMGCTPFVRQYFGTVWIYLE